MFLGLFAECGLLIFVPSPKPCYRTVTVTTFFSGHVECPSSWPLAFSLPTLLPLSCSGCFCRLALAISLGQGWGGPTAQLLGTPRWALGCAHLFDAVGERAVLLPVRAGSVVMIDLAFRLILTPGTGEAGYAAGGIRLKPIGACP